MATHNQSRFINQPPSDEEEEEQQESEEEEEPKSTPTQKPSQIPQKLNSCSKPPTKKRPLESQLTQKENDSKKKKKTKITDEDMDFEKKKSVSTPNRLWNNEDYQISILKGMVEFKSKNGIVLDNNDDDMAQFHDFFKQRFQVQVSKNQLSRNLRRLKNMFFTNLDKGKGKDPVSTKPHDFLVFMISKKIWGCCGNVDSVTSDVVDEKKIALKANIVNRGEDFKSKYPNLAASCGMNEWSAIYPGAAKMFRENMSLIGSDKASVLEEKWKELQVEEAELMMKRLDLIREQYNLVVDAMRGVKGQLPLSFFKIMMSRSQSKLTLPPAFCLEVKEDKSETGILTSCKGTWNVKIGRSSEGYGIYFDEGWRNFVQNHSLTHGDFAVFEYFGNMNFNVTLFDLIGCKKKSEETEKIQKPVEKRKGKKELEEPPYYYHQGSSKFMARMKPYNVRKRSPYMLLPAEFCQTNALYENTTISLRGPSGKSFPVSLRVCNGGKTVYAILTSGWYQFFSMNNLKLGDLCIFQLDRTKTNCVAMDVRVESSFSLDLLTIV